MRKNPGLPCQRWARFKRYTSLAVDSSAGWPMENHGVTSAGKRPLLQHRISTLVTRGRGTNRVAGLAWERAAHRSPGAGDPGRAGFGSGWSFLVEEQSCLISRKHHGHFHMGPHPAARHHAWVKIALSWVPRICCPGGSCQIPGVGAPVCMTMARVRGLTLILLGLPDVRRVRAHRPASRTVGLQASLPDVNARGAVRERRMPSQIINPPK
jgi:hypothetical protein